MWASVPADSPLEPNYSSIEQLFCLPVAEPKDKGPVTPARKEPKEVWSFFCQQSSVCMKLVLFLNEMGFILLSLDFLHWPQEEFESEHISEAV